MEIDILAIDLTKQVFQLHDASPRSPVRAAARLFERDEPSVSRPEATDVEIKATEVRCEIHMEPFTASLLRTIYCFLDQNRRKAMPPKSDTRHCVENESMHAAIPGDVNEPNELLRLAHTDPA